ncbi:hypothetical protein [Streptomyces sp. bgisy027]|uniref:hypothetical protein n=1 Tax=unclassified Streptomyces TaxID=2593676 RepID=UPI003D74FFC3
MAHRRWSVLATALMMAAAGCESAGPPDETAPPVASVATRPVTSTPGTTPDLDAPEVMAQGLDVPWGLAFLPGAGKATGRLVTAGWLSKGIPGAT